MATPAAVHGPIVEIPLGDLRPSPLNPRKSFDDAALAELAASITAYGVKQPILVRQHADTSYEIVVGERRWRASQIAKKKYVPAIVESLSDEQVRELQIVENLQRADVHPLEEADAYHALVASFCLNPAENLLNSPTLQQTIAAKVAKPIAYVAKRAQLVTLIAEARKCFVEGDITIDHAQLIAALAPDMQMKALKYVFNSKGYIKAKTFEELVEKARDPHTHEGYVGHQIETPRALRNWIESTVALELSNARWDLDDAQLHPQAGPCTLCPKRAGQNKELFGDLIDVKESTCLDPKCFGEKRQRFVDVTIAAIVEAGKSAVQISHKSSSAAPKKPPKEGEPDKRVFRNGQYIGTKAGECEFVVTGVFVDPPEGAWGSYPDRKAGAKMSVCVSDQCKKHRKAYQKSASRSPQDNYAQQQQERDAREKRDAPLRIAAIELIVESVSKLDDALLRAWLTQSLTRIDDHTLLRQGAPLLKKFFKWEGVKDDNKLLAKISDLKTNSKHFAQAIALLCLAEWLSVDAWSDAALAADRKKLIDFSARFGQRAKVKAIFDKADAQLAQEKADAKKGKAKAAAAGAGAATTSHDEEDEEESE